MVRRTITNDIDTGALLLLKNTKHRLTKQQYKTIRGQIYAGDPEGAVKGLRNILQRRAERMSKGEKKECETERPSCTSSL